MKWNTVKLKDVATIKGGKRLPKGHELGEEPTQHPYIRARDIRGNRITFSEPVYISDQTFEKIGRYIVNEGDIVVTIVGANIGDVGFVSAVFDGANLTENAARIRADTNVCNPKFLSLQLSTGFAKRRFHFLAAGSAQGKLGLYKIKDFDVTLPRLATQNRIASILSVYDDLIENNLRRIKLLDESVRLLYREWFLRLRFPGHEHTRIVDVVPEGWERKKMADVCDSVGGGTPSTKKPEYWEDGDVTWVIPSDITKNDCLILLDSEKTITEAGLQHSSAKMLPPDTILMTSRASVGFFGLIDVPVCTNQGFISVIPNDDLMRWYLLHNLMARREEIISLASGATYREINKTTFRDMDILVPTHDLLQAFSDFASDAIKQMRLLKKQKEAATQARDILLPKLMNGEIAA